jgi:hypothetical protein
VKKTASILLLGILFFNWIGYRFLTSWLEDRANLQLERQLDNNDYDQTQLISLKLPLTHLAYYVNSNLFERVDGKVEIKGVQYHYVKRRLYKDSLELICIFNHSATTWRDARNNFLQLVNDLQLSGQDKKTGNHSGSSKIFLSDYCNDHHLFDLTGLHFIILEKSSYFPSFTVFNFSPVIENPPEYCQVC